MIDSAEIDETHSSRDLLLMIIDGQARIMNDLTEVKTALSGVRTDVAGVKTDLKWMKWGLGAILLATTFGGVGWIIRHGEFHSIQAAASTTALFGG